MKKITAILLIFSMLASMALCACAQELDKPVVLYDYETGNLAVSGSADVNEELTLYILNPGFTAEDIYTAGEAAVQYFRILNADKNGKYNYTLKLADYNEGEYNICVKANGKETSSTVFNYANSASVERIVKALIGEDNPDNIKAVIGNSEDAKSLQIDKFPPFISSDVDELSIALASVLKSESLSGNYSKDFTRAISIIRTTAVVNMYNKNKRDIVNTNTDFLYEEELGLSELDAEGKSFYTAFKTILDEDAQKKVIGSLFGQNFEDVEALRKKLAEKTILVGVSNVVGYGHVTKLLTAGNCAYVGMTYKNINNAQAIKIVGLPEQNTIANLQQEIQKILDDPANSQLSAGGGGGAPVSTGGASYVENVTGASAITPATPSGKNYFSDIEDYEWADEAIGYLYQQKIVSGTGNNSFAPAENLTREQFAKVLCILKGIEGKTTDEFSDVSADEWYAPYIGALAEAGLINGIGGGAFGIGYNISRQDLCVMIYRAFEDKIPAGNMKAFADEYSISDYAKDAVAALSGAKILNGFTDGTFRPQANCTRAEMAKIVYEVLKLID